MRHVTVCGGSSSSNGINWRLLVARRKRNRPVGEDLPPRVVFPLGEDTGCVLLELGGDGIRPPPPANLVQVLKAAMLMKVGYRYKPCPGNERKKKRRNTKGETLSKWRHWLMATLYISPLTR
jgi:hypothetical protein